MEKQRKIYFNPEQMAYLFGFGWRRDNFEIGFRHYCTHPIIAYMPQYDDIDLFWEGSYEEVFIRFSGDVVLLK